MSDAVIDERRLVLMRHAKSDWPTGVPDEFRPLSERGRRDAPVAGRWILDHLGSVDLVVVSPAERTRQTCDLVAGQWPKPVEVRVDPRIYEAEVADLVEVIGELPDDALTVVMIGHNPGTEECAARWPNSVSAQAASVLGSKFPTCAMAVITATGPWRNPTSSILTEIVIPRG